MKLCPQGHPNDDDAVRCVECYQQFDEPEPAALLRLALPTDVVRIEPGGTADVDLRVHVDGVDHVTIRLSWTGAAAGWLHEVEQTLAGGPTIDVRERLHAPADATPGEHPLVVEVTSVSSPGAAARGDVLVMVEAAQTDPVEETMRLPWVDVTRDDETRHVEPADGRDHVDARRGGDTDSRRARAPWLLLGAAAAAAVLVAGLAFVLLRPSSLSPQQALELSPNEARAHLDDMVVQDTQAVLDARAEQAFLTRVSGKCTGIAVDLRGPRGIGFPDGIDDVEPVRPNHILAYHLAMEERFGRDAVRVITRERLGGAGNAVCPNPARIWLTYVIDAETRWLDPTDTETPQQWCQDRYADDLAATLAPGESLADAVRNECFAEPT